MKTLLPEEIKPDMDITVLRSVPVEPGPEDRSFYGAKLHVLAIDQPYVVVKTQDVDHPFSLDLRRTTCGLPSAEWLKALTTKKS